MRKKNENKGKGELGKEQRNYGTEKENDSKKKMLLSMSILLSVNNKQTLTVC